MRFEVLRVANNKGAAVLWDVTSSLVEVLIQELETLPRDLSDIAVFFLNT
jgi:hypothetical protein